jgi:hypothetical protein
MDQKKNQPKKHEFKVDKKHAQLLIRGYPTGKSYDDLKRIIESTGIRIVKVEVFQSKDILLMVDNEDMRETVLELTERGYFVEGINALR